MTIGEQHWIITKGTIYIYALISNLNLNQAIVIGKVLGQLQDNSQLGQLPTRTIPHQDNSPLVKTIRTTPHQVNPHWDNSSPVLVVNRPSHLGIVLVGICPGGIMGRWSGGDLSWWGVILVGTCPGGQLSGGELSRGESSWYASVGNHGWWLMSYENWNGIWQWAATSI